MSRNQATESTQLRVTSVFFSSLVYLATSTTNGVETVTGLLFCAYVETPSEKTGL